VTDLTPPNGSVSITEEGSTLLLPLFELWSDSYHQQYSNIRSHPVVVAQARAFRRGQRRIDIGASDAYLSSSQVSQYPGLRTSRCDLGSDGQLQHPVLKPAGAHVVLSGQVISQIYQGKSRNGTTRHRGLNPTW